MDRSKEVYQLVKQWCQAHEPSQARAALHQIALISGCISSESGRFTAQEDKKVMRWLQENHPNIYLWALTQRCMGHPAMVWGTARVTQENYCYSET